MSEFTHDHCHFSGDVEVTMNDNGEVRLTFGPVPGAHVECLLDALRDPELSAALKAYIVPQVEASLRRVKSETN